VCVCMSVYGKSGNAGPLQRGELTSGGDGGNSGGADLVSWWH
jgi:hypothetical protein